MPGLDRPQAPGERGERLASQLAEFARERTQLLPALWRVQEALGYLPDWALEQVAAHLRVPRSEVYSVATHYPELRLRQPGRHLIRICTGVPCRTGGADALLAAVRDRLGIAPGETTPDGEYTLETVGCCFACSMAPLADIDHEFRGRLSPDRLERVIPSPGPTPEHDGHRATESPPVGALPSGGSPAVVLGQLRQALAQPATTRLLVGAGMCGLAVGAGEVVAALREALARRSVAARVVEAGCDGACFRAVQVAVEQPDGTRHVFTRVRPEQAEMLAQALAAGTVDTLAGLERAPDEPADPFFAGQRRIVLEQVGRIDPSDLGEYLAQGGYTALVKALEALGPEGTIETVKRSGLLGRGGAYFPAAVKWEAARKAPGEPKYLVVNAEEGEPGVFKDRHLLEGNPHQLLEGLLLAAFAIGASRGVLFVNGEARLAYQRLARAVAEARAHGLIGPSVLGSGFAFELELRRGAGGFILGEETALLECIEGQRAMPRVRPPFPVERGLYGRPTVINNVETLSAVPAIVRRGGEWYAGIGQGASGTKVFSLAGDVARPGVAEVEIGATVRHLVEGIGGGAPDGQPLQAVLIGGPSGRFLPPAWLDDPLAPRGRFGLGSGGVTAIGAGRDLASLMRTLVAFNAAESCGKCTPCREGLPRLLDLLDRGQLDSVAALLEIIQYGSLCGLGQAAPLSVESLLTAFSEERRA